MDYYRNLLLSVSTNMKSQESMPYNSKSEYNIFQILEVTEKEVVMCRFLTDLLNPEGQHGCGILFLKSFFNDVLNEKRINDTLLAHTNVIKEFAIDNERRIDIVIYNTLFFIPIEVKIYAGEQEGQCYDYFEYAKTFDENAQIVYLTRFGSRMPDGVVFLADCVSSRETLDKYAVSFIYDVGAYLKTLDVVERMEAAMFVPAHGEASANMKELVHYNRDKVRKVAERILSICEKPLGFEGILREVFKGYGLTMNFEQYVLVGSTVRSYLSWLKDNGKLAASFQDSMLLWQRA